MFTSTSRKWIAVLVGVLALVLLTGAGTARASQTHFGPVTSAPRYTQAVHTVSQTGHQQAGMPWSSWKWIRADQTVSQTGHEWAFTGIVQSIDQAKQTFRLLPSGQTKAVTIAYDAHTGIPNDHQTVQLTVGMYIVAHVMTRSDGSLYGTKIELVAAHWNGVPARVNSDSYPAGPYVPCDGRDHHGSGYHH